MRKDIDVEFEGFTYPERTINIEVAYDFRKHGYTERNYISDPDEYSNLFHWKGRRTAGASTFRPRSKTTRTS